MQAGIRDKRVGDSFYLHLLISNSVPPLSLCHLYSCHPYPHFMPSLFLLLPSPSTLYVQMRAEYTTNANNVHNHHPHHYHTDKHNLHDHDHDSDHSLLLNLSALG